jgi:hypothetical protein
MRKTVLAVAVVTLLLMISAPAYSNEFELGLSWMPVPTDENQTEDTVDSITGFHIGYVMLNFLYASWDALVMPPSIISDWTGLYRPGFLNLYDAGIRIQIKPVVVTVGLGLNSVYVYDEGNTQFLEDSKSLGANLRVGAGVRFDWWGVSLTGTAVFPTFDYMVETLKGLVADSTREYAAEKIVDALLPAIALTLYF